MNNGGKVALLGLSGKPVSVNLDHIVLHGLFIKGIYGREMFETWYKMVALIESGLNIEPIITHTMKVDDYIKGFELMKSGLCGKVILDWT
jgi:threonine 3-dehydrogenase